MLTAIQHQTSLPARSSNVAVNGAKTIAESSLPSVVKCMESIKLDPVLRGINFEVISFSEVVFKILRQGSVLERAALAKNLTPEAAFYFPSAWIQVSGKNGISIKVAIHSILKPMFDLLAEHFGVNFNGNADSVGYALLSEFGGLSFADFLICFDRVKSGRYWKETQHIMTRGINHEFMVGWLNQYCDDREIARAEMYKQTEPYKASGTVSLEDGLKVASVRMNLETKQQSRADVMRKANDIFVEWEKSLYTSGIIRQAFKFQSVDVDQLDMYGQRIYNQDGSIKRKSVLQETICDENDKEGSKFQEFIIRTPLPGAIAKKIKRIIFEFIANGKSEETVLVFDELTDRIRKKYSEYKDVEACLEVELKTLLSMFQNLKRTFKAEMLIEPVFRKLYPTASEHQILASVKQTVTMYEDQYFADYLPACIEKKYPRLDKKEFLIVCALPQFIEQGFNNPFLQILD